MFPAEAIWIGTTVTALKPDDFPLLDVGSQTADFRRIDQPWIVEKIFESLRAAGRDVVHVDIQTDVGVDLVADLATPEGREAASTTRARSILCSNLLEHVPAPESFLSHLIDLLPTGGHLILTGPTRYPYHPDPIDNRFRRTSNDIVDMLTDDMTVMDATQVEVGTFGRYLAENQGRLRLAARLAMPFWRPARWIETARWLRQPISAFCVHAMKSP